MKNPTEQLMRTRRDQVIGGVAVGLGQYLNVDPVIVRVVFVLLTFLHGVGIPLYLVMWVVMPRESAESAAATAAHATSNQAFLDPASSMRQARFDPMTGEPRGPEAEGEIPVQNLNAAAAAGSDMQMRRNWVLGAILIALGLFFVLKSLLPAVAPFVLPALLIAVGVFFVLRSRENA